MATRFLQHFFPSSELAQSFFPPPTRFSPDKDIPDLTGKVFLVTGGSAGIGKETTKQLLRHGGKVYLAARTEDKARGAMADILKDVGDQATQRLMFHQLDLGDLRAVKKSAEDFLAKEGRLDVLYCNAGVMMCAVDDLTTDGYDMQFGTNVLGHYYFTKLLIPALLASHEASGVPARIVNLASSGHKYTPAGSGFIPASLIGGPERDKELKSWGMLVKQYLYGQSKLANIFLSDIFATAHPNKLVAVSIHPGAIHSELGRHLMIPSIRPVLEYLESLIVFPIEMGAFNSLWAGVVAAPEEVNRQYVIPWTRVGEPSEKARNAETTEEVRQWLEKQLLDL